RATQHKEEQHRRLSTDDHEDELGDHVVEAVRLLNGGPNDALVQGRIAIEDGMEYHDCDGGITSQPVHLAVPRPFGHRPRRIEQASAPSTAASTAWPRIGGCAPVETRRRPRRSASPGLLKARPGSAQAS